ncbi:DNA-binding protein [Clostridium paraputrificum]|uniref:DNA-binding protein n=1 Tax=Clostridium TaxID=1485 RepID=UPI003D34C311
MGILNRKTCNILELSQRLKISHANARRLTEKENFPRFIFGGEVRIVLSELDEFLENYTGDIF